MIEAASVGPFTSAGECASEGRFEAGLGDAVRVDADGDDEAEHRAPAELALDLDLGLEECGEFSADGEAQAGASVLAGVRAVELIEGLEDAFLIVGRDAGAGVDDADPDAVVLLRVAADRGRLGAGDDVGDVRMVGPGGGVAGGGRRVWGEAEGGRA